MSYTNKTGLKTVTNRNIALDKCLNINRLESANRNKKCYGNRNKKCYGWGLVSSCISISYK